MANKQQAKRRAARRKDFQNQNISSASDFDFNQHGENHVSQQEINHLRSQQKDGEGFRDTYAALQKQKEGGAEFSARAQKQYDRMTERMGRLDARKAAREKAKAAKDKQEGSSGNGSGSSGQEENAVDKTVTGKSDGTTNNTDIRNTQEQEVNQDNDINTNINGSDNTVINNQDNSVRQYGGDNRSFVYNSNGGSAGSDTPVSAATMAGFYDVDDSPAAQAQFNDMYTTMNRDNQKRYAGAAMETFAKYGKMDARDYTPESMSNTIGRSTQYSYDKADEQTGHVFGDIWNDNYITENWKMPTPPKEIKSDAADIAEDAKEDIDNV